MDWAVFWLTVTTPPVLCVSALLILMIVVKRRNSSGIDQRPPIACNFLTEFWKAEHVYDIVIKNHKRYRTWRTCFLPNVYVLTTNPANVQHIMKNNFCNYRKGNKVQEMFREYLGNGILFVDGELWKQQRKLAVRKLSVPALKDESIIRIFKEHSVQILWTCIDASRAGQPVKMQRLLQKSTIEMFCKVAYGIDINGLSNDPRFVSVIDAAFVRANIAVFVRHFDWFWRLKRRFNILTEASLKKSVALMNEFAGKLTSTKLCMKNSFIGNGDLLSEMVEMIGRNPENFPKHYVEDIAITFMIAGTDTTVVALAWFFYLLSKHRHVKVKIVEEIQSVIQARKNESLEESIGLFLERLTHSNLQKMHYLHAALTETMRLYPPVPLVPRDVVSDDILPDGYKVRKGEIVIIPVIAMGRMPYLWGEDAEDFKPERWLDKEGIFQADSPFKFSVFQGGPRACLGKDFSYIQMKIISAILIYFLDFERTDESPVSYRLSTTLHLRGKGLPMRVWPRVSW